MTTDLSNGRVIVTYGRSLMALSVAQSLGARGVEVIGADDVGLTVMTFSRFVRNTFLHAPAAADPDRFIDDLEAHILRLKPDDGRPYVLMPCFQETRLIARHAERLSQHIAIAAPPIAAIDQVDPKDRLAETARRLGLRAPRTWTDEAWRAAPPADAADLFPLLVKPARGVGGRGVRRVDDAEALAAALAEPLHAGDALLIQDYIEGEDYCFTALFDRGELKASSAYRNLTQYPVKTGAGVLRETVAADPFEPTARRLFGDLNWTGVVEVDFRWNGVDEPWLIEVNPRFWAGLFHTVESGVDYPWMLYELAAGAEVTAEPQPILGQRTRVPGLFLLAAIQEVAETDEGLAAARAAWDEAAKLLREGNLIQAVREAARAAGEGLDLPRLASRLKQILDEGRNTPGDGFKPEDPLIPLGWLFVADHILRHGRLPPELVSDPAARGLLVE